MVLGYSDLFFCWLIFDSIDLSMMGIRFFREWVFWVLQGILVEVYWEGCYSLELYGVVVKEGCVVSKWDQQMDFGNEFFLYGCFDIGTLRFLLFYGY